MNGWRLEMTDEAMADLGNVPSGQLPAILRAIRLVARDPSSSSIKKLRTPPNTWRLRVGGWRVLFEFKDEHILKIMKISDRKDAY